VSKVSKVPKVPKCLKLRMQYATADQNSEFHALIGRLKKVRYSLRILIEISYFCNYDRVLFSKSYRWR